MDILQSISPQSLLNRYKGFPHKWNSCKQWEFQYTLLWTDGNETKELFF